MTGPSRWSTLRALFQEHRRRLATAALILFLAAVALEIGTAVPRAVEVSVPMGREHAEVTEVHLEYAHEGEPVRTLTRRFAGGAPAQVRDRVELSPGEYDVSVRLVDRAGRMRIYSARLTSPADGVVSLALEEES